MLSLQSSLLESRGQNDGKEDVEVLALFQKLNSPSTSNYQKEKKQNEHK